MQIQYTGLNMEITDAIRELTQKKMQRIHDNFSNISTAHFTFKVNNKERQRAELTLNMPGLTLHAKDETEDMYKSIDSVIEKMKAQLLKHKNKLTDHR